MRTFILGTLMASLAWTFLSLDGCSKLSQAWNSLRERQALAAAQDLAKEREVAFGERFQPDRQCLAPASELKKLECSNRQAMAREKYYAEWNRANAHRFPK